MEVVFIQAIIIVVIRGAEEVYNGIQTTVVMSTAVELLYKLNIMTGVGNYSQFNYK